MKVALVLLLCVLRAALLASVRCSHSSGPDDCCFEYYPRKIKGSRIKSYYMTESRCSKDAAVLVTQTSRHICVNPEAPWVVKIMAAVDERDF